MFAMKDTRQQSRHFDSSSEKKHEDPYVAPQTMANTSLFLQRNLGNSYLQSTAWGGVSTIKRSSGEPEADKKKSDDNGGSGVPDGLQKFVPKTPNTKAEGSAVGMVTVEKPQQADWDNGFDEKAAARFGGGQRHTSVADLGKNLKIDPAKEDIRISQLIICGHGNKNMLAAGSGDGPDTSDALNIKESNKATWLPFFQRDKFFGQGEIWIISCNVGSGPIPQLMADQSGSVVFAYTRTAFANEKVPFPGP
jgi:hypothetical protein